MPRTRASAGRTPSARRAAVARLREKVDHLGEGSSSGQGVSASAVKASTRKKRKAVGATSASARKAKASRSDSTSSSSSSSTSSGLGGVGAGRKKRRRPLAALRERASPSASSGAADDPPMGIRPPPSDPISEQIAAASAASAAPRRSSSSSSLVDQARRETDIRREDTSRRMLSELSHANSKKESLERQLRRAAEDGKEAASRLAEIETDAARDKARMGEEIRALKRRLRSAEVAEQGELGKAAAQIRELELQLVGKANAEQRADALEGNVAELQRALDEEKARAKRDQKKLAETLDMLGSSSRSGNSSSTIPEAADASASRHLARIAQLERAVRSQQREAVLLKKRVEKQMLLEERISELEAQSERGREDSVRADRLQSEVDHLVSERQSWNESFVDIVKSLRASAGVMMPPTTSSSAQSSLDECTVATANQLLRELQQRQAIALQQTGNLQSRIVELEAAVEKARRSERESGRRAHESKERNARLEEDAVAAQSRIRFLQSEKTSFQKMISSYQQELEMDDAIRNASLTKKAATAAASPLDDTAEKAAATAKKAAQALAAAAGEEDRAEKLKAAAEASAAEKAALRELLATRTARVEQLQKELGASQATVAALQKRVDKAGERESIAKNHAESTRKRVEDLERLRHGSPSVSGTTIRFPDVARRAMAVAARHVGDARAWTT